MRYSWHCVVDMVLWCDCVPWYDILKLVLEFWYSATLTLLVHCDMALFSNMTYCIIKHREMLWYPNIWNRGRHVLGRGDVWYCTKLLDCMIWEDVILFSAIVLCRGSKVWYCTNLQDTIWWFVYLLLCVTVGMDVMQGVVRQHAMALKTWILSAPIVYGSVW